MKPLVFAELDLAEALEKSKAEKKLLLVDATAEWCEPCKFMDGMTWSDPKVVAELGKHALAVQIDVDAKKEDAARLKIKAMPTVVAFRDGAELDRAVGMQGPEEFLDWLDGLLRGETYVQKMRREATERPDDMELRVKLASHIKESGQLDEATTEYVWLWKHMLGNNPEALGLRHVVLPGPMSNLVETHAPARAAFSELRDAVAPELPALEALGLADWLTLNTVLGEAAASLAWYEANAAELAKTQGEVRAAIKNAIIPMLIDARRWSDVGDLEEDPAGEVRRAVEMSEQILKDVETGGAPEDRITQMKAFSTERVSKTAGMLARAMRAAGREGDAKLVEDEARKHGIEPSVDEP